MGRHKTEVYYITEDERIALKARMLELGYKTSSELARRLNRDPANVASIVAGVVPYPKSFDDELKELGINVVHNFEEYTPKYIVRADGYKIRRELMKLGYEGTKDLMSMGYRESNMISGNAACTKSFIKDMYDLGIDVLSLCRMTEDKYVQPKVDPALIDSIISNVPGIDRKDKMRNAYMILVDAMYDAMYCDREVCKHED